MPQESTPLLIQSKSPNGLPPFQFQGGNDPPPPYETVEIVQNSTNPSHSRQQPGGIASIPYVAIVAVVVAFILIFGVTLIVPNDEHQMTRRSVLKQSEPSQNLNLNNDAKSDPGYKDITIPQGRLRGFTKKSRQGRNYTAYYKVPYAEPPLGTLRFKDPIPPQTTWEGLRAIPVVAPQCIQKEKYSEVVRADGEEDCLYANIYVPHISQEEPLSLPVMVYIHGGGFTDGNGSRYGADYFMDENVILITFQYRLGPLGFISTNDDVIRGNMGLKDQVEMLKWTRDNVQYFGGDPNVVTIYGNSGGGMSVSYLMLSPMATGLFHRAITQSGANICAAVGGMLNLDPMETIHEIGRVLNCDSTNSTAFLECVQTKDAAEISLVRTPPTMYTISVENLNDDQVFMPDTPYNVLKSNPNKVPYIVGVVNSEWTGQALSILMNPDLCQKLNDDFAGNARELLGADMTDEELLNVKNLYFGDKEIGNSTLKGAINMTSDRGMIHCSYVSAKMHAQFSPAYLYYLSKPPAKSYADKAMEGFPAKELGIVSHADELQYFFLYDGYPEIPNGDPEYFEFSKYLVKLWATFAANGEPSSDWEQVHQSSTTSTFWFELNDNPARTEVIRERMDFWDQFTHKQLKYE